MNFYLSILLLSTYGAFYSYVKFFHISPIACDIYVIDKSLKLYFNFDFSYWENKKNAVRGRFIFSSGLLLTFYCFFYSFLLSFFVDSLLFLFYSILTPFRWFASILFNSDSVAYNFMITVCICIWYNLPFEDPLTFDIRLWKISTLQDYNK